MIALAVALVLTPLAMVTPVAAQVGNAPDIEWETLESGISFFGAVAATQDGGVVTVSQTTTRTSDGRFLYDALVVKYASDGTELWRTTLSENDRDIVWDITETSDGDIVITGYTVAQTADGTSTQLDGWVVRLDASGTELWSRTYTADTTAERSDGFRGVTATSDGGVVLAGVTRTATNDDDAWVVKLDTSGDVVWSTTAGGEGFDQAVDVEALSDDSVVFYGSKQVETDSGLFQTKPWLVRVDATGNILWQQTYDFPLGFFAPQPLAVTSDDRLAVLSSQIDQSTFNRDVRVVTFDSDGVVQWSQTYGDDFVDSAFDIGRSIIGTSDGGFAFTGSTPEPLPTSSSAEPDMWVVKLDSTGGVEWSEIYGDLYRDSPFFDAGFSIAEMTDGGYAVKGQTTTEESGFEPWLVKLEALETTIPAEVDVLPGSEENPVELDRPGRLPVAILGSAEFDVTTIDTSSLAVEGVAPVRVTTDDVNEDGYADLVLFVEVETLVDAGVLTESTTELVVTGELTDGTPIEGADSVTPLVT
ncbi:hypothetical protein N0B31_17695 [Salinirubellus salinus]|uniref:Bulb-type lectin domain-containing protein n=1 Tax=Salinirubellus salinus TaxID=1364945 RepID=A0A9E7R1E4_9EURY|nr:hypothetical protein [Salinirubellus salinus]UWM53946.1 hypothetical protein N0B31_17695 [Salinirubellus salinus]